MKSRNIRLDPWRHVKDARPNIEHQNSLKIYLIIFSKSCWRSFSSRMIKNDIHNTVKHPYNRPKYPTSFYYVIIPNFRLETSEVKK